MGEVWKAIATGVVTLFVGFVLLQVQLGGRRRRLRREITEELQLIELLGDEYSIARGRVIDQVRALLAQYEPGPKARPTVSRWEYAVLAFGAVSVPLTVLQTWPGAPWWVLVASGTATGALVSWTTSVLAERDSRRRSR